MRLVTVGVFFSVVHYLPKLFTLLLVQMLHCVFVVVTQLAAWILLFCRKNPVDSVPQQNGDAWVPVLTNPA